MVMGRSQMSKQISKPFGKKRKPKKITKIKVKKNAKRRMLS
jgi:hypothetical protein